MRAQQLERRHTKFFEVINSRSATETCISTAQFLRQFTPKLAEAFHVHFVDHRFVQRDCRSFVMLPVERHIDDNGLRHAPRVIAKILGEILLIIAHYVTEHLIGPTHTACDRFGVRIEQKFRTVEAEAAPWIVRPGNTEPVQLSRPHIRQEHVPNLISMLGERNADAFFSRPDVVEQAKFDTRSVLRKNSEVDAVPHPRGAQRIWITEESPYWSHKHAAHLSGIERALAIANGGD